MKHWYLSLILLSACAITTEDPQTIVDRALEASGSNSLDNARIEFRFRQHDYGLQQRDGRYEMIRIFKDSTNLIHDILTNDGFVRQINGSEVTVADTMAVKYTNSINSVIYFALLPYKLNDAAVMKQYLGSEEVSNKHYHKIKVTFMEDGGGEDHEDEFIYWINESTNYVDYLAYSYHTDGGGQRFRVAYNPREINGVRVVDYINFKPQSAIPLEDIAQKFEQGELEELSRIKLENVIIEPLNQ